MADDPRTPQRQVRGRTWRVGHLGNPKNTDGASSVRGHLPPSLPLPQGPAACEVEVAVTSGAARECSRFCTPYQIEWLGQVRKSSRYPLPPKDQQHLGNCAPPPSPQVTVTLHMRFQTKFPSFFQWLNSSRWILLQENV